LSLCREDADVGVTVCTTNSSQTSGRRPRGILVACFQTISNHRIIEDDIIYALDREFEIMLRTTMSVEWGVESSRVNAKEQSCYAYA
jgi:hypothetical protein